MPKAGLFAEKVGEVVGKRIAARLLGKEPKDELDGQAVCYVESGRNEAVVIGGDFLAKPKPEIRLSEISLEHFANKH